MGSPLTDSRNFEGTGLPDGTLSKFASDSRLSRLSRPIVEVLDVTGGFRFAVVCLCLMSLAVGLFFNRTVYSVFALPALRTGTEYEAALQVLVNLDSLLIRVAGLERTFSATELNAVRSVTSKVAADVKSIVAVLSETPRAEDAVAAAKTTLSRIDHLGNLMDFMAGQSVDVKPGETTHERLAADLRMTRSSLLTMLERMPRTRSDLGEHSTRGLSVLVVWFWAFLVVGTLASILFLRLLRDEITQRLARECAERRADFLAFFDPATGLGNRFQLQDRVSGLISSGQALALMLVDIDDFRRFNDRHGRLSGDVALREIAYRIQDVAEGNGGFAARLSEDDFAVVVPDAMLGELSKIAEQMSERCRGPIARAGQNLGVSVSIGVASLASTDVAEHPTFERLMRMADFALETARSRGVGRVTLNDDQLEKQFQNRRTMSERLPRAIDERELRVYFQPQIDLENGRVVGFESQIRWFLDERQISASDLAHAAEKGGLVQDLDRHLIDESISVLSEWNRRYRKDFSLSVSISVHHLPDGGIVEFISSCLDRHAFPPGQLTLEITESAELDREGHVLRNIERIRDLGCRVSIDDFGTGYSWLGGLRNLGVDEVKIDRSFVSDIENSQDAREFLKSILRLPACLGRAVIVEGIESAEQETIVKDLGAKRVQGGLHGNPRPAAEWLSDATFARRNLSDISEPRREIPALSA